MRHILIKPRTISIKYKEVILHKRGFNQVKDIIDFLKHPFRRWSAKRLNRKQHLKMQLIAFLPMLVFILILMIANVNFDDPAYEETMYFWMGGLVSFYSVLFSLRASIARLHDCNHSGWWILLIGFLSIAAGFPILLLCVWPGTNGENKYGYPY
jgi:uncharacterized membrane protein YhaH (DUF805 family)